MSGFQKRPPGRTASLRRINRDRGLSQVLDTLATRLADIGLVATPDMSMREIVGMASSGGTSPNGHRVLLSEGVWFFKDGGFEIAKQSVHLISLSPGRTIFKREGTTATAPLLTLSGVDVRLSGIQFDDEDDSQACIKVTGDNAVIQDCLFEDCFRAVEVNGANRVQIKDNVVVSNRDTNYGFLITGTSVENRVTNNSFETDAGQPTEPIYFGDDVDYSLALGNIAKTGGRIISTSGSATGNVTGSGTGAAASNVGSVSVR